MNAGVAYDATKNKMKAEGLRCNFQRLNNSYPFGYIYDDHGHLGFVGAKISPSEILDTTKVANFHKNLMLRLDQGLCMNEIFSYDGEEVEYNEHPEKQIP